MADFSENVVKQLQNTNKKLDAVVSNTEKVATSGAKASEEKKEAEAKEQKRTSLFEDMAKSLKALHKSFLASVKEKGKMGLGIIIAAIAAPIIALVAFFKQLAVEFMFLKKITGKGIKLLFKPLKGLFAVLKSAFGHDINKLAKLVGDSKIGKGINSFKNFFTRIGNFFNPKNYKIFDTVSDIVKGIGTKIKTTITALKNFFAPVANFFKSIFKVSKDLIAMTSKATGIVKFASKFGSVLGKLFLPITILMSAFDFITGFMAGYEEGGILGGLEGGLTKLFQGLIGMPLDLLKSAVSWILGKFGFKNAEKALDSFSFSTLISDIIGGIFGMITGAVDWIKLLFSDPVAALKTLWSGLLGTFKSLTDILYWPLNKAIDWIKGLFGWGDPTEPFSLGTFIFGEPDGIISKVISWVKGLFEWGADAGKGKDGKWSLSTMITEVIKKVKTWVTGLFTWASTEDKGDSWIVTTIKGVVDGVKLWLGNMFKFDSASSILASAFNVLTFMPNMVLKGLQLVTKYLLGLFGFDAAAEKVANADNWTIGSMLMDAIKTIKDFFWNDKGTGILNFDLASALPDFEMPDLGKAIGQLLAGIFPDDWILGKGFVGTAVNLVMPNSLIDMLKNLKGLATGGVMNAGQPTMVGELGPELIMPSSGGQVMNAERTAQMQESGLQRGAGAGGAPTIVSAPVTSINNSSSNTSNTTTSFSHPSAIINTVNVAA